MQKDVIQTGKTVEAAIEAACEVLGCERDACEWEIIDLPKKGLFGLKNTLAKVRVSVEIPDEVVPQPEPVAPPVEKVEERPAATPVKEVRAAVSAPQPMAEVKPVEVEKPVEKPADLQPAEYSDEKIEAAKAYIADVVKQLGLDAKIEVIKDQGGVCLNLVGENLGAIIGRRGETLDALQYLTVLVANRAPGSYMRLTIDCGDYRTKRKATLESLARKLSSQVLKTNVSKTLEPMNPFERRIIHATVSEIEGVSSTSVGEEPNRRVVITSPTAHAPRSSRGGRPSGDRGRYDRNRGGRDRGPRRDNDRDRNRGGRDRGPRRDSAPRSTAPEQSGPPKQTPEATQQSQLYAKIDLE